jgi:hypothetical protein
MGEKGTHPFKIDFSCSVAVSSFPVDFFLEWCMDLQAVADGYCGYVDGKKIVSLRR